MEAILEEAMEYLRSKETLRRDNSFKTCDYKGKKGEGSLARKENSVHCLVFNMSVAWACLDGKSLCPNEHESLKIQWEEELGEVPEPVDKIRLQSMVEGLTSG